MAAMTAVDHSKVLTRRRSAMKGEKLQRDDDASWTLAAVHSRENPAQLIVRDAAELTVSVGAVRVAADGDGVPRNRPRCQMTPAGMPAGICLEAAGRICFSGD